MDVEPKRFGSGPRELGGAVDLINQYKLWPQYESFCKKSIPLTISETRYLRNVVGDTEIRRGEGMELDQLCRDHDSSSRTRGTTIQRFDLELLGDAFRMKEIIPAKHPGVEMGIPKDIANLKSELNRKKKCKKLESKDKRPEEDETKIKRREEKNNLYGEQLKGHLEKRAATGNDFKSVRSSN